MSLIALCSCCAGSTIQLNMIRCKVNNLLTMGLCVYFRELLEGFAEPGEEGGEEDELVVESGGDSAGEHGGDSDDRNGVESVDEAAVTGNSGRDSSTAVGSGKRPRSPSGLNVAPSSSASSASLSSSVASSSASPSSSSSGLSASMGLGSEAGGEAGGDSATRSSGRRPGGGSQGEPTSRFVGVSWSRARGQWRGMIMLGGVPTFLGHFDAEDEAALVYDAEAEAYGESELSPSLARIASSLPNVPSARFSFSRSRSLSIVLLCAAHTAYLHSTLMSLPNLLCVSPGA